jgi:hypothetical protein
MRDNTEHPELWLIEGRTLLSPLAVTERAPGRRESEMSMVGEITDPAIQREQGEIRAPSKPF